MNKYPTLDAQCWLKKNCFLNDGAKKNSQKNQTSKNAFAQQIKYPLIFIQICVGIPYIFTVSRFRFISLSQFNKTVNK
jgi:hypothetical protein